MNREISNKFSNLSFLFTIVMIVYHAQWDYLTDTRLVSVIYGPVSKFLDCLAGIAMSYFFMTSGYMLYNNATKVTVGRKLQRRVKSLVIPYITWNVVFMLIKVPLKLEVISNISELLYHFSFSPFDGPLWYVFAIIILCLIAPLIMRFYRGDGKRIWLGAIAVAFSCFIYGADIFGKFGLSQELHMVMWSMRLLRYMPAYIIGSAVALNKINIDCLLSFRWRLALIISSILILIIWLKLVLPAFIIQIFLTVMPILLWLIIDKKLIFVNKYGWVRNSFLMYASHFLFIYAIRLIVQIFHVVLPQTDIMGLIIWGTLPLVTALITYLSCCLMETILKPVKFGKILDVFTGGRS